MYAIRSYYGGNAYHRLLELLDFTKTDTDQQIRAQMETFIARKQLSQEEADLIMFSKITGFVQTDLAKT